MLKRVAMAMVVAFGCAAAVSAQSSQESAGAAANQQPAATTPPATTAQEPAAQTQPETRQEQDVMVGEERRPATTTFMGDTGLWFVPTAEILPAGKWSFSVYRVNFDYNQGFTDVSNWPVTLGVGIADRAELFGAFSVVRRIDRDLRPIFIPSQPSAGGVVNEYPFVRQGWSDNQVGDLLLGVKLNLLSQWRQQNEGASFALRGMVKVPTASDDEEGVGTGKPDFGIDAILSKEFNERVELSGFGGLVLRGDPDDVSLSNGFRYGIGLGTPSRRPLRLTAELHGEAYFDDSLTLNRTLVATDGSVAPPVTDLDSPLNASLGLTYQHSGGFFAGAGLNWRIKMDGRSEFGGFDDETGDSLGLQLRLGYHPGVRTYVAPPPPPPPPPPAPEHVLTVEAQCNPCEVPVGGTSLVTSVPQSSIGCSVTYNWTTPSGTLADPAAKDTKWTAPMQPGTVPVTITVTCPQDGKTASDDVNIRVIPPAPKEIVIEDVHFDFDRYSLRPEATRALDEAVAALKESPKATVQIEGHTCNIGTAEYNLALGDRRANSVREYLVSRGVGADRLQTTSYGEERPKHDNSREETRRLNRRAALVVRVQLP